jgi:hypothetical protein
MTTETAITRSFDLILTKYGISSGEVTDASVVLGDCEEREYSEDALRRLEAILENGRSWRSSFKPNTASDAPPFGSVSSEF